MNIAEFTAYHVEKSERLRRLKCDAERLGAFIQRCRIELDTMREEIGMLEDHIAKDNASGSVVMEVPQGADDDSRMDGEERRAA